MLSFETIFGIKFVENELCGDVCLLMKAKNFVKIENPCNFDKQ